MYHVSASRKERKTKFCTGKLYRILQCLRNISAQFKTGREVARQKRAARGNSGQDEEGQGRESRSKAG